MLLLHFNGEHVVCCFHAAVFCLPALLCITVNTTYARMYSRDACINRRAVRAAKDKIEGIKV